MPNRSSSHIPIQRLTDIQDEQLREYAAQGIQTTLDGNLAHLRSIKDTEHKWVDLFSIVTLPGIDAAWPERTPHGFPERSQLRRTSTATVGQRNL